MSTSDETQATNLQDIEQRLSALEMDVEQTANLAKDAIATANEALEAAENADGELREDVERLEQRLDDLADRTDLLKSVKQASALSSEEKAAVCLQTLVAEAQNSNGTATMTAREARKALGGDVDRTLMYDVLPRAAELVDDEDVVWYQKESRGSQKKSRLIVDLDNGSVPGSVAGYDLTGGDGV